MCGSDSVITFFTYLTFKTCNEKCTKYINCTRVVAANARRDEKHHDALSARRRCSTADVGTAGELFIFIAPRGNAISLHQRGTVLARLLLGVICGFEALLR